MRTIAGSIAAGILAAAVIALPWAWLARANVTHASAVPWAVPIAAAGLWGWWQYMGGKGAPVRTATWRRVNLRARRVSEDVWASAMLAGMAGIALSLVALNIANRVIGSQYLPLPTPAQLPPIQTALALNFMGATIAGVVEEAAFRGFMQAPIERRFGPVVGIGVSAIAFWLAHLTRTGTIAIAPFYLVYGIVFGSLAFFSRSIYPGIVLHAGGDALAGLAALARPVAQDTAGSPASVVDATLPVVLVAFVVLTVAVIAAFRSLARAAERTAGPAFTAVSSRCDDEPRARSADR